MRKGLRFILALTTSLLNLDLVENADYFDDGIAVHVVTFSRKTR